MRLGLLAVSVLVFSQSSQSGVPHGPMQAHEFRATGPWFEGWYTRVTDPSTGVSLAVITTSAIHENQNLAPGEAPPGYVAVALQTPVTSKTISFEAYPQATKLGNLKDDFRWIAPDHGMASKGWTDIEIKGQARVQVEILDRKPWANDGSELGPEGLTGELPMPLHWFVHNTAGRARYAIDYEFEGSNHHVEGTGLVHQEKNWGATFPKSWIWLQGVSKDGAASIALAGGDIELGPLTAHAYMVGYRSGALSIDFAPIDLLTSSFSDEIDACRHQFELIASNSIYELKIEAVAPKETFAELSIPTAQGYTPGGAIESFATRVRATLYKKTGPFFYQTLEVVEVREFDNAALEFGANAMLCNQ